MDDTEHRRYERVRQIELEMIKATAAFEHVALRPPSLLNGGALVVYLALYGALSDGGSGPGLDQGLAKAAMLLWIIGLVMAAVATAWGAWSQFSFRKLRGQQVIEAEARIEKKIEKAAEHKGMGECFAKRGNRARVFAVVFVVVSLVSFVAGVNCAFFSLPS